MDRDEQERIALTLAQILARFDVRPSRTRRWLAYLDDLRRILLADYVEAVDSALGSHRLPLRDLIESVRERLPEFNRRPLALAATLDYARDRRRGLGLNIRLSRYGEQGHPLRGFYHFAADAPPLIWVNRQHTPTAISASFAHELGHHFWQDVAGGSSEETRTLQHDGLAQHLAEPRELFADIFATLSGYPTTAARNLFGHTRWGRAQLGLGPAVLERIAAIESHVHRHYPGDLSRDSGLPESLRLYYLGSMIHFSKVRAAVLRVAGV